MKRSRRRIGNALLTGALVVGGAAPAAATGSHAAFPESAARHGGDPAVFLPEDEALHRFVDAVHDVAAIRRSYAERMRHAGRHERRILQMHARDEMLAAIERHGLDATEYEAIGDLLENDGELSDRLEGRSDRGRHT